MSLERQSTTVNSEAESIANQVLDKAHWHYDVLLADAYGLKKEGFVFDDPKDEDRLALFIEGALALRFINNPSSDFLPGRPDYHHIVEFSSLPSQMREALERRREIILDKDPLFQSLDPENRKNVTIFFQDMAKSLVDDYLDDPPRVTDEKRELPPGFVLVKDAYLDLLDDYSLENETQQGLIGNLARLVSETKHHPVSLASVMAMMLLLAYLVISSHNSSYSQDIPQPQPLPLAGQAEPTSTPEDYYLNEENKPDTNGDDYTASIKRSADLLSYFKDIASDWGYEVGELKGFNEKLRRGIVGKDGLFIRSYPVENAAIIDALGAPEFPTGYIYAGESVTWVAEIDVRRGSFVDKFGLLEPSRVHNSPQYIRLAQKLPGDKNWQPFVEPKDY